jgi:hypothetical protein
MQPLSYHSCFTTTCVLEKGAANLGLILRALFGVGTPRAAAELRLLGLAAGDRVPLMPVVGPKTGSTAPTTPTAIALI